YLRDKKMPNLYPLIKVGVRQLLSGQLNVAAYGTPSGLFCPTVGCLHKARATAGHYRKAELGKFPCRFSCKLIIGMAFHKTGRAKNGDAGAYKMELPEAPDEFPECSDGEL